MSADVFSDITDWGKVIDLLEDLKESGRLNDCQDGLARLLRNRENWKLRESALEASKALMQPSDEVLAEALGIMMDDGLYIEARALAADAVGHLAMRRNDSSRFAPGTGREDVVGKLRSLLGSPQAPMLQEVARRSLDAIEKRK